MYTFKLFSREDNFQPVRDFVERLFDNEATILPAALLFQNLLPIDHAYILYVNGAPAGIVTFAPQGEERAGDPQIVSVWIDPELKSHPEYPVMSQELFQRMAEFSLQKYEKKPFFCPATKTEMEIVGRTSENLVRVIPLGAGMILDM